MKNDSNLSLMLGSYLLRKAGPTAIARKRQSRLNELVAFARANSPYYKDLYKGLPEHIEDIKQLPVTNKKKLMAQFDEWATDRDVTYEKVQKFLDAPENIGQPFLGNYRVATTSGSTGSRGIFLMDAKTDAVAKAFGTSFILSGLGLRHLPVMFSARTALIIATGGHTAGNSRLKSGNTGDKPNVGKRQLFSVHLPLAELVSQLNQYQPAMLHGYASTIVLLANEQEAGRLHINPILVLPTSEGLTDREYYTVIRAFRANVATFYGSTECGLAAQGCRYHWQHLTSDWVIVEPVDADFQPVASGVQSHTVLVSNLTNYVQPILQYDIGDSILMRPDRCPCGNPMPAFQVLGRVADILNFPAQDGTAVKITSLQLSTLFDSVPEIQLPQVIQTDSTTLRVRLLIAKEANQDQVWQKVQSEINNLLRSHKLEHVQVERATEPPEQAMGGKYREVIPLNR